VTRIWLLHVVQNSILMAKYLIFTERSTTGPGRVGSDGVIMGQKPVVPSPAPRQASCRCAQTVAARPASMAALMSDCYCLCNNLSVQASQRVKLLAHVSDCNDATWCVGCCRCCCCYSGTGSNSTPSVSRS